MCCAGVEDTVTALAWSPFGSETEDKKFGVIIAGLKSGKISFWSPDAMLAQAKGSSESDLLNLGCLGMKDVDSDPINCLAVNKFKPNLIVSGGSALLLHNFDKSFENADSFTPTQEPQDAGAITSVAWNYKIAHIFASAADTGMATVWDVKNKKSIMTLNDNNFGLETFSNEGAAYDFAAKSL